MAPSPPEHATSAVDQAYDAFDESSITLQEMVEKKLSAGSINRQTHTSLDRNGNRPLHEQLGGPNSPCFERTALLAPRLCKEGIKAKTFSAPAHSMSQLYKMLETYEAIVGKKIIKSSATVETEPESGDDKSVSDEVSATAPANEMDVDQEASSTISLLPAAVITGPAESRAGSGAVPAVSIFQEQHTRSWTRLFNKARKIRDQEVRDQEAKSKASKSGSSKDDVIVIDEPVELPFAEVVRKKTAAEEKAEAHKRKKKMEPKFIITVRNLFSARPAFKLLNPRTLILHPPLSLKHRASVVAIAVLMYMTLIKSMKSHPTQPPTCPQRAHAPRSHKELKRQAFICGYRIKHFMSLRKFYLEEIAANKAELDDFHDEMDAE
ncbi:hypothetical protein B0H13DRAFT_2380378 [Mycena leptocephala]|nr:hypothetical protein B0H13DRAFT_2380378 [Mycena leptocephala]